MPFGVAAAAIGAGVSIVGNVMSANKASDDAANQQKYAEEHTFSKSKDYNPNAFQYGGGEGGADAAAATYNKLGTDAQGRQATQVNYGKADKYAAQGDSSANGQRTAAGMMMARANGSVPLVAQQQATMQSGQLAAQQSSQAASARGAAGLALASQTAATNTANGQAAISQQAQISGSQEQLANTNAAGAAYSNLRQGDSVAQGQAAQQAQQQAELAARQKSQNDAFQIAQQQNEINVRNNQLQAGIAQQGMLSGNAQATNNAVGNIQAGNAAAQRDSINRATTGVGQAIQMGGGMMGGGAGGGGAKSDPSASTNSNNTNATAGQTSGGQAYAVPRAAGGPVSPGQPYLVGEKGPELVVPSQPAMVVPNRLTQAMAHSYAAPASSAPLMAPAGQELHQSLDGHAFYQAPPTSSSSSADASESRTPAPPLMARKKVATKAKARKMTDEELMAAADKEIASVKADTSRRLASAPSVGPVAQSGPPAPPPGIVPAPPPTPQQSTMLHALLGTMTPDQIKNLGRGLMSRQGSGT